MWIQSVKPYNFRNLSDQSINFDSKINFIVGSNGQGKTNIIEAVGLLSHTKSLRGAKADQLCRIGERSYSVFGKVNSTDDQIFELGVSYDHGSKAIYKNGEKVGSLASFLGNLICVTFFPKDLGLIKGMPAERRGLIDKFIIDLNPVLISNLLDYQRAVRSKNSILKSGHPQDHILDSWDSILARLAQQITNERVRIITILEPRARDIYEQLSHHRGSSEQLSFNLESQLVKARQCLTEQEILGILRAHRANDILRKSATIGPHRDDLLINIGGKDARKFSSQGQARSAAIALKLAMIELIEEHNNCSPIVLLDDVDSELDSDRRGALFNLVLSGKRQVIITGTEIRPEVKHDYHRIEISNGALVSN